MTIEKRPNNVTAYLLSDSRGRHLLELTADIPPTLEDLADFEYSLELFRRQLRRRVEKALAPDEGAKP